jgi:hypothetical protein
MTEYPGLASYRLASLSCLRDRTLVPFVAKLFFSMPIGATRYHTLAPNFLAATKLVGALYWVKVALDTIEKTAKIFNTF